MANLKLTILRDKPNKDGSFKIRVSLTHRHDIKYILTKFSVDNASQFKNGQVVKRADASTVNRQLRILLNEYQDALDEVKNVNQYSCRELRNLIVDRQTVANLNSYQLVGAAYVEELNADGRGNYAKLIERNNRYFAEFCRGDVMLDNISPTTIANYDRFLRKMKRLSETSVGMMMARTRTIINRAIKQQLVSYDIHPYAYYKIKASAVRELDLPIEDIRKIRDFQTQEKKLRVARDLFMLSFYLAGMNLADLMELDFRKKMSVTFTRKKVRNTIQGEQSTTLPIIKEAREIIDRWMDKNNGLLNFGYKLSYANFYRYLTRSIHKMSELINIDCKVVYYSARKSFAQIAYEIGIQDGVIDYCLGHSDKGRGVIRFYTKVRREQADFAIRSVVGKLNDDLKTP